MTVEAVRERHPDASLFVVSRAGDRFEAIERPAQLTGLPVRRAGRDGRPGGAALGRARVPERPRAGDRDPLGHRRAGGGARRPRRRGDVQRVVGLGPATWTSAAGRSTTSGRRGWRSRWPSPASSHATFGPVPRLLLLPPAPAASCGWRGGSPPWTATTADFCSCNRAFHLDPASRLDRWCGECDKCCFIDLVLAPFMPAAELPAVFAGREPLADPALLGTVPRPGRALGGSPKPFECVGEMRRVPGRGGLLAAARPDRDGNAVLRALVAEVGPAPAGGSPGRPPPRRPAPAARRALRPRCATRPTISAGLTCAAARSGCGASASRAGPTSGGSGRRACDARCWWTTAPAAPDAGRPAGAAPPTGAGWRRSPAARWW